MCYCELVENKSLFDAFVLMDSDNNVIHTLVSRTMSKYNETTESTVHTQNHNSINIAQTTEGN